MKKRNRNLISLGATFIFSSVIAAPLMQNIVINNLQMSSTNEKGNIEVDNNFLHQKNKYGRTSSQVGYFEFIDNFTIRFSNYSNEIIWEYDVRDTTTINLYGKDIQKGSFANPFSYKENMAANSNTKLLDAQFNEDLSKIVVLSGIESNGTMYLSLFQIDVNTGLPYVNNINTPEPIYNSAFTDSTYGGNLLSYPISGNAYPFISISNNLAIVMVNNYSSWNNVQTIDLNSYISVKKEISAPSGINIEGYTPYAFSKIDNNNNNILLLSKQNTLSWVKMDSNFNIIDNSMVTLPDSFSNLNISSNNPTIIPYPIVSSNGDIFISKVTNTFFLQKYSISSNNVQQQIELSNETWKIKFRAETNTAIVSDKYGIRVVDIQTGQIYNPISFPPGMENVNFKFAEFQLINSDFNSQAGEFNGGTGGVFDLNGKKYLIKITSDFSNISIEEAESIVFKNTQELFSQSDIRFKLATTIKLDDVKDLLGFVGDTTSTITLLNENNNEVTDPTRPIYNYYNDNVDSNSTSLSFRYNIDKISWWNSNVKIKYSNISVTLSGFSTISDYYVKANPNGTWNGMNFLPSRITKRTILDNMIFGSPEKNGYPIKPYKSGENYNEWLETNSEYIIDEIGTTFDENFAFPAGKYIKLYANDNDGTLIIQYNFSAISEYFGDESGLSVNAIKGSVTISGFKTTNNYENFYPNSDSIKKIIKSSYTYNIDKQTIINSVIPKNISSGYNSPFNVSGYENSWTWTNLFSDDISKISSDFKPFGENGPSGLECAWNNYLGGIIEYNGPSGYDVYPKDNEQSPTYTPIRIFIIPIDAPNADDDGNYTIEINGKEYSGKLYNESDNFGDMFINSKDLINGEECISIINKVSGQTSGSYDNSFDKNLAFKNNGTVAEVITDNVTNADIENVMNGNKSTIEKVKNYIFNYYYSTDSSVSGEPSIEIHDNWLPLNSINIAFEKTADAAEGEYYSRYKLSITIDKDAQTNIPYGNSFFTISQLNLDNGDGSIFDMEIENIEILEISRIYEALSLQQYLIDEGVKLIRNDENFYTKASIFKFNEDLVKKYYSKSPETYFNNLSKIISPYEEKEIYAQNINNNFGYLDEQKTYETSSNPIFKFELVKIIPNNYNGELVMNFQIRFYDPKTEGKLLPESIGREIVTLRLSGFDSYIYELIMWATFASIVFLVLLFITLLVINLRKERNKKRLWNIKK